ncbi:MAG: SUF system NifU family Fe-S cluster assembly protein [Verrucomicrobia bacterium CG_4_10_14_3_um_filter_43_23]|nr:MAG: SUF system NifU family Fe-S cluster assembly protein [Verrucomicrobia bacterium CG1_02_43_26]PIX58612.1 MAG: SUF system NifU family Fe-S cluster assembly protein [Verrucomicrobia bacterium CG_4_10_14_3_um_filter_43_23]PIY61437.1 MAG: SUF system NifU family Fe-S cluster assembly protein [Verrucomicrobia bacterium CG_4_10_14_0_8_um_filter_43_34]PJA43805.1 MAG: SUF system NifU family Fe-S cluster assembly protein [Verrucomicrobia bacterium CG_4_9_14_3_um_filter_43_20]
MDNHISDLYQEIILDHNKHPCNAHKMCDCSHCADGHNPLCGDQVTVYVKLENDKIEDISFVGQGCAIFKASASLMTLYLKGKTLPEAVSLMEKVNTILTSEEEPDVDNEDLGDLVALLGVRRFPVRVKCATLPWHAFKAAIEGDKEVSTES